MPRAPDTWYERACRQAGRYLPMFKGEVGEEFYDYINFTGLDVRGEDARALAVGSAASSAVIFGILTIGAYLAHFSWVPFLFASMMAPISLLHYLGNYPKIHAEMYKVRALGTMPELVSNLAMALKAVPNLERAVEFAALKTRGQMGSEFRKMVWDTYMRIHKSSDDALTKFAEKWKKWNEDFASSIYLLKGSLLEKREEGRSKNIDRSVDVMLKGTIEKMEVFARSLSMPILSLYFFGMILPLIMIAVMPTLAYVGTSIGINSLFLVYNIILPLSIYLWSRNILAKRPVTVPPPEIPDDHPDIPPKGRIRIGRVSFPGVPFVLILGGLISIPGLVRLYHLSNGPLETSTFFSLDPTIFVIWGVSIGASSYLIGTNFYKNKLQIRIKVMEREFLDALTQLGNRTSEGRPIEDAFAHVGRVMKGSEMGRVFSNSANNMIVGRKTLRSSLFDKEEGALRDVHSVTIRSVMEVIVEAAKKGSRVTGVVVARTAEHLSRLKEVDDRIEQRLDEVISSMRSTTILFGPFVGGVVVSLQQMMNSKLLESRADQLLGLDRTPPPGMPGLEILGTFNEIEVNPIPMGILQLIIGIYIIEMVVIFSCFMSELYMGDKVSRRMETGKNLVVATLLFTMAIAVTQSFLR
jgi:Flp pilus assembly protein TadB